VFIRLRWSLDVYLLIIEQFTNTLNNQTPSTTKLPNPP
jgi:hypothetical protein